MAFLPAIRAQQCAGQSLGGIVKNLVIDGGFNHGLSLPNLPINATNLGSAFADLPLDGWIEL